MVQSVVHNINNGTISRIQHKQWYNQVCALIGFLQHWGGGGGTAGYSGSPIVYQLKSNLILFKVSNVDLKENKSDCSRIDSHSIP